MGTAPPNLTDPTWLAGLLRPDRADDRLYTDPAIFELEMRRIWDRAWVYIGHESEIPKPGDFVTTRLGRHPIVLVRDDDGSIYVLRNRCAHRGARVVVEESGNCRVFACSYHSWAYRKDGTLLGMPLADGYGPQFDRRDPCLNMPRAPRVATYRGFVFASLSADGPPLLEFLGGMTSSFDDMVDRAPAGEVETAGGVLKHAFDGNWKLYLENLNDVLHPISIHESAVISATKQSDDAFSDGSGELAVRQMRQNKLSYKFWDENIGVRAYRYGHSYMASFHDDGRLIAGLDAPEFADYRALIEKRHGEARAREILRSTRFNSNVYPSCTFMSEFRQMRILHPVSATKTIVHTYSFRLKGAPDSMFVDTVRYANIVNSPASPVLTDDLEIYERIARGLEGGARGWLNMARGIDTDITESETSARTERGGSELHLRNMAAAWMQYMSQEHVP